MNIVNSSFCLFSNPVDNDIIRSQLVVFEKELSGFFAKPFNLITLPVGVPLEIPRITATSLNGFSILNISLNSYQFLTRFDKNYSNNWNKCRDYISERIYKIYDILYPFFKNSLYCGLTVNLLQILNNDKKAIDILLNNFTKFPTQNSIYDIDSKFTFIKDDDYYINIRIHNQRISSDKLNIVPGTLKEIEHKNNIGILLDINDKYGFNYKKDYSSNKDKIDKIIKMADEIINNKIEKFVMKGEI